MIEWDLPICSICTCSSLVTESSWMNFSVSWQCENCSFGLWDDLVVAVRWLSKDRSCSGKELPLLWDIHNVQSFNLQFFPLLVLKKKKGGGANWQIQLLINYLHFMVMFISHIVAGGARSSGKHLCKWMVFSSSLTNRSVLHCCLAACSERIKRGGKIS